jgi:hypothetical protein
LSNISHYQSFTLPEQTNYEQALALSLTLAVERLSKAENLESLCHNSDSQYNSENRAQNIVLKYLNKFYRITFPGIYVSQIDSNQPAALIDNILILHYLLQSRGTPISNRLIAFQELKECASYLPSFLKRSVRPLIDHFGRDPGMLIEASADLGGMRSSLGDISVTIPAFARIPVTYVIWKGDDEFPPNASILFDDTVLDYLPAEDIIVLCQTITWRLIKSLK